MAKILPATLVVLECEGVNPRRGQLLATFEIDRSAFWSSAANNLRVIAGTETRPEAIGCCRVRFALTFNDGMQHLGTCELRHPSRPNDGCDISAMLTARLEVAAGRRPPPANATEGQRTVIGAAMARAADRKAGEMLDAYAWDTIGILEGMDAAQQAVAAVDRALAAGPVEIDGVRIAAAPRSV